jgi:hypothetical protein
VHALAWPYDLRAGLAEMALARVAIWVLSIGAAILILMILGSDTDDLSGKAIEAVVLFALFGLCSMAGFLLIERQPQLVLLGVLAIAFSVIAYLVVLDTLWSHDPFDRHVSVETLVIITLVIGQVSMLLSFRREDDSPLISSVLLGSLVALALLCVLVIVEISSPGTDIGPKTFAIVSVLYLLGALLPPLLRRAEGLVGAS